MKKDTNKTDVVFRIDTTPDFKGTCFALFPHEVADHSGNVTFYQHVGQHSAADYGFCIQKSRPATNKEFADLKKELSGIGYNLNIVQKQNRAKYLKSYYATINQ
jgi:hypothetical protein